MTTEGTVELGPGGRPVGAGWSRSPVYGANGMAGVINVQSNDAMV